MPSNAVSIGANEAVAYSMVNQPHDASQVKVDPNTGEITVGPAPGGNGEPNNDLDSWLKRKDAPQA